MALTHASPFNIIELMRVFINILRASAMAVLLTVLTACATGLPRLEPLGAHRINKATLIDVPFYSQAPEACASTALRSILEYHNIAYGGPQMLPPPGFTKTVTVVNFAGKFMDASVTRMDLDGIKAEIDAGRPLMLLRQYEHTGHYYLVKGYAAGKLVVNDGYRENLLLGPANQKSSINTDSLDNKGDIVIIFSKKPIE